MCLQVGRDQKFIDYVSARFRQEIATMNLSLKGRLFDSYNYPENWQIHCPNFVSQMSQQNNYSSFEGSSSCSSLSNEHQVCKLGVSDPAKQGKDRFGSNPRLKKKKGTDYVLVHGNDKAPGAKNREKGPYKSKNLITERNRRERIKAGMFALRALVPNISKVVVIKAEFLIPIL